MTNRKKKKTETTFDMNDKRRTTNTGLNRENSAVQTKREH